jgi:hypothetical protein
MFTLQNEILTYSVLSAAATPMNGSSKEASRLASNRNVLFLSPKGMMASAATTVAIVSSLCSPISSALAFRPSKACPSLSLRTWSQPNVRRNVNRISSPALTHMVWSAPSCCADQRARRSRASLEGTPAGLYWLFGRNGRTKCIQINQSMS